MAHTAILVATTVETLSNAKTIIPLPALSHINRRMFVMAVRISLNATNQKILLLAEQYKVSPDEVMPKPVLIERNVKEREARHE